MNLSEIKSREDARVFVQKAGRDRNRFEDARRSAFELARYGTTLKPPRITLEDIGIESTHPEDTGCKSWSAVETYPKLLAEREELFTRVFIRLLNPPRIT